MRKYHRTSARPQHRRLALRALGAAGVGALAWIAAATGITFPPLFATLRALIATLAGGLVDTAFALEAVIQELFFIVGPLLLALVVAVSTAQAALAVAAALVAAGTIAFAATPASRAWRRDRLERRSRAGALSSPGIRTIVAACLPELAITRPRREPVAAQARWTPARPDGRRLRSIPLKLWPDQPAAQAQTAIVDRLRRSP